MANFFVKYMPWPSIRKAPAHSNLVVEEPVLSVDQEERGNGSLNELDDSAPLLGRKRSRTASESLFALVRWNGYSRAKVEWRLSYRKRMASFLLLAALLWQILGLFRKSYAGFAAETRDIRLAAAPIRVPGVPQYVLDYAPLVWLHINESYFPSDMMAQVSNTTPKNEKFQVISDAPNPLTLDNLSELNKFVTEKSRYNYDGTQVFLTSNDDVTTNPAWLNGSIPNPQTLATNGATSSAIIINDHGSGEVDVFYTFFYAYNQGNTVKFGYPPLGFVRELGDHIGDWEHVMIRFINKKPSALWYSQHEFGASYTYDAVCRGKEVQGKRPYVYSAIGSHANYAVAGSHDHTLPNFPGTMGLLNDYTSRGYLWDPTLSAYFYNYNASTATFTPLPATGTQDPNAISPVGAMDFRGQWGDQRYPDSDPRQHKTFFFYKYESGPTGPREKQLQRKDVCPTGYPCHVRHRIGP